MTVVLVALARAFVASIVVVVLAFVLFWPRLRRALDLVALAVAVGRIPPVAFSSTTAGLHTGVVIPNPNPIKEPPTMGLIDEIEKRFTVVPRIISDVEQAARSKIGQELLSVGKTILELLPEGSEAALVITKLEEAEQWAHKALVAGAAVTQAAETDTANAGAAVEDVVGTDTAAPAAPAETAATDQAEAPAAGAPVEAGGATPV